MHPFFENRTPQIYTSYNRETYDFPAHFHSHIEVAFCFSGKQHLKIGETVYTMKKGDTVVIFPNEAHEYIKCDPPCDEPTEIVAFICNAKLLSEIAPQIVSHLPSTPHLSADKISRDTVAAFRNITKATSEIELLGWTCIILSNLLNNLCLVPTDKNPELPSKITSYINNNFKEKLTINHIAKVFGYHPSYIAHLFCDRLKIPFRTYLGAVRSEYAASQIQTTDKSLTEIAYDSGYDSLNTFCRSFKKHFSKTPSQYRKDFIGSGKKYK